MRDVLQSIFEFVEGPDATDEEYFNWLHKVYDWEVA
jgi:hypothetical protein